MKTWRDWLQDAMEDWEGWFIMLFAILVSGCAIGIIG